MAQYTLRQFLIDEMKRRDMSYREFAALIGESHHDRLHRIVTGKFKRPDWDFILNLSKSLGLDLEFLVALLEPDLAKHRHSDISPLARRIAEHFDNLPEEYKAQIASAIFGINTKSSDDNLPVLREIDQIVDK
jgi:transcriptional regulator with XRE-family HTH domain